jgi:hypothetical protein
MIKLILIILKWSLWGPEAPKAKDVPMPVATNTVQEMRSGKMSARVFLNRDALRKPYFKVTFSKVYGKEKEGERFGKSFLVEDLDDLEKLIRQVRAWIGDSKVANL